jgi:hypothetical protein
MLDYMSWSAADWRWSSARVLARKGRWFDPLIADNWISASLRYLRHRDDRAKLQRIAKRWPMVAAVPGAMEIAEGPKLDRLAVEARLLALEPVDVVAARAGRPTADIEAYERLFLDFRARHDSSFWIDARVIQSHIYVRRPQTLRSAVLRLAYRGPAVAEQVLTAVSQHVGEHTWDTIASAAGEDASATDRLTLMALATLMAPWTTEAHAKLSRQYRRLRRDLGLFGPQPEQTTQAASKPPTAEPPLWEHLRVQIQAAYEQPRPAAATAVVA